jgi:uroporphyrinogen decarboxylase
VSDRLLRALRRESVDATPVWFMRQAGRSLPEYRAIRERARLTDIVADAALCAEVSLQPVRRLGVDAAIVFADITTPLPGIGVAVDLVDGVGPVIADPIRTRGQVEALRRLDPEATVGSLLEAIALIRAAAGVPVIGFAGAPFTLAAYLIEGRSPRDLGATKALMHGDPTLWDALLTRIVDMDIAYLRAQVGAGAQVVQLFDSWVGQLGPYDYRASVQPHVRRLIDGLADLDAPVINFGTGRAAGGHGRGRRPCHRPGLARRPRGRLAADHRAGGGPGRAGQPGPARAARAVGRRARPGHGDPG